MTDEEKAKEYYEDKNCCYYSLLSEIEDYYEIFGFVEDIVKKTYLDGLEEGRKENTELKEQIEKMKYCQNCENYNSNGIVFETCKKGHYADCKYSPMVKANKPKIQFNLWVMKKED